jgi:hypothetical protein
VEVAWFYGAYSVQGLLLLPWSPPLSNYRLSNYRLLDQVQRPLLPTLTGDRCPPAPALGWGQGETVTSLCCRCWQVSDAPWDYDLHVWHADDVGALLGLLRLLAVGRSLKHLVWRYLGQR